MTHVETVVAVTAWFVLCFLVGYYTQEKGDGRVYVRMSRLFPREDTIEEEPEICPKCICPKCFMAIAKNGACGCEEPRPLPIHRTEAGYPKCSTCDGGGCLDCTDPA